MRMLMSVMLMGMKMKSNDEDDEYEDDYQDSNDNIVGNYGHDSNFSEVGDDVS